LAHCKSRPYSHASSVTHHQSRTTSHALPEQRSAKVEVKPTLQVINDAAIEARPGVTKGQTLKPIVGHPEPPADPAPVAVATYEPGSVEQLPWHASEDIYFVIHGQSIVRDCQGNEYEARTGT